MKLERRRRVRSLWDATAAAPEVLLLVRWRTLGGAADAALG